MGKGTGLGLSVVYKIITDMGGHILMDSEPGAGTTVSLLFKPLDETESESAEEHTANSAASGNVSGSGQCIMVVDDEASLAEVVCQILDEAGYQTQHFVDGDDALAELKRARGQYHLLISDQTMPKMTGLDLIEAARSTHADLPVLLCSGYSEKIDPKKAAKMGLPFLQKPVRAEALLDLVAEILDQRSE